MDEKKSKRSQEQKISENRFDFFLEFSGRPEGNTGSTADFSFFFMQKNFFHPERYQNTITLLRKIFGLFLGSWMASSAVVYTFEAKAETEQES